MPITNLSIDIETFSSVDLQKCGVYKYAESDDFRILLFGYSIDNGPVEVVDLELGETIPGEVLRALSDNRVIKWAFNAAFERVCLSRFLGLPHGRYLNPSSWRCSMIWSAYLGLPLSLKGVGSVLKLDKQKMVEGKDLIRFFCKPYYSVFFNEASNRHLPSDDIAKWETFKAYNKRDVETELAIKEKLSPFSVPESVWNEYVIDQVINDRGVLVDMDLVRVAIKLDGESKAVLMERLQKITELQNPNSVSQMKDWLRQQGTIIESLGKKEVKALLNEVPLEIREALELRLMLSKSSIKKYQAMLNTACCDNRTRGMFQFYGANRTGRFAGRYVQLQNLPQNHIENLEEARSLIKEGKIDSIDDLPDTLSQLIRTAFIAKSGMRFIVSDYSAIEARVIAWFSGEEWRQEVFKENGDIYSASASKMFGVSVSKHGENSHLRQKGKIAELALGYGGSIGALTAMGALDMGLKEEELKPLVENWRQNNPHIVAFWWEVDRAVKTAIKTKETVDVRGLKFSKEKGILFIRLLSGRRLAYIKPKLTTNRWGSESVSYEGIGSTKKWERIESYGPKFVENIVQATSRDILCFAMKNLRNTRICMHIHDEIVIEAPSSLTLEKVVKTMSVAPDWAAGLVLNADGYKTEFYKKD